MGKAGKILIYKFPRLLRSQMSTEDDPRIPSSPKSTPVNVEGLHIENTS